MSKVTVKVSLRRFVKNVKNARRALAEQVLIDSEPYVPIDTGSQRQRAYVGSEDKSVVYPGPYANYLYRGKKMVNRKTGKGPALIPNVGYRYKRETKLKPTGENLKFSDPNARAQWVEEAKKNHGEEWRRLVADKITKR